MDNFRFSPSKRCSRCGEDIRENHHQCPARQATCRKCNFRGHYAKCCLSNRKLPTTVQNRSTGPPNKKFKHRQRSRNVDSIQSDDETEYVFHLEDEDDDLIDCKLGGHFCKNVN